MSKTKNSSKAINWITGAAAAYFIGTAIAGAIKRKRAQGTNGIGAVKRRIYKELSLAQQAGVDFTKKYDELDEDEIKALEKVSSDTGYTETYYKSLKKAYDAVSGIGEAYDVVDADGNTVLTWIEDAATHRYTPAHEADDPERWRALREAHEIDEERQWAQDNTAQLLAEREARLAEQRKRIKKAGRSSQMALFGIGYAPARSPFWYGIKNVQFIAHGDWGDPEIYYRGAYYNAAEAENELYAIWREELEYGNTDLDFEAWMHRAGGEYLKSDVLPFLSKSR